MSKWIWQGLPLQKVPEDNPYGFVYLIVHKPTGGKYVGQKAFFSITNPKISKKRSEELYKGRGKRPTKEKKIRESNWKKYQSSNKVLKEIPEKDLTFVILGFAKNKSDLNMMEIEKMVEHNVMRDKNSFNEWLSFKIRKENLL